MVHILIWALKLSFLFSVIASPSFQCSNQEPGTQTFLFLSHLTSSVIVMSALLQNISRIRHCFVILTVITLINPPTWLVAGSFLTRCHNSLPDSTLPFQAVLNTAARMIFLNWNQNLLPFCPSLSRRRSPVLPMPRGPEWSASCSTALMVLPPLPFLLIASARLATWMFLEYTCLKARSSHLPDTHVVSRHCRSSLKCLLSQNVAFSDHLILNCN